ncbi:MAG TPA: hypothetical protein VMR74_07320, partial [Gammaproteobacteria bacterium]|nr:hypothetical protein [Gammaproteobacteria bacterium]
QEMKRRPDAAERRLRRHVKRLNFFITVERIDAAIQRALDFPNDGQYYDRVIDTAEDLLERPPKMFEREPEMLQGIVGRFYDSDGRIRPSTKQEQWIRKIAARRRGGPGQ